MIDIHWYDSQSGINQIHLHKTICLWDINFHIWKERSHASSGDKVFPCNSSTHQQWKLHELNGNLQLIEDQNINRKHLQISTFPVEWWVCETQPKTSSISPSCFLLKSYSLQFLHIKKQYLIRRAKSAPGEPPSRLLQILLPALWIGRLGNTFLIIGLGCFNKMIPRKCMEILATKKAGSHFNFISWFFQLKLVLWSSGLDSLVFFFIDQESVSDWTTWNM